MIHALNGDPMDDKDIANGVVRGFQVLIGMILVTAILCILILIATLVAAIVFVFVGIFCAMTGLCV